MESAHLELSGISKRYGAHAVLGPIDLSVAKGQYVVLLGPSGSGKTTLLSIIGGFTAPSAGQIRLAGRDITLMAPAQRPTATVFQDYALFPHLSIGDNVAFGLTMRRVPSAERQRRALAALETVGLYGYAARRVHELSGGQKQRVALARALLVEPEVLLLDEPLGALDLHLRRHMQAELKSVQLRSGRSFVHVTHDQEEAMAIADLIVLLNQGKVEDIGSPQQVYQRPSSRFSATFMGESTLIDGVTKQQDRDTASVETPIGEIRVKGSWPSNQKMTISVRPENVIAGDPPESAVALGAGKVTEIGFQGNHLRIKSVIEAREAVEVLLHLPPSTGVALSDRIPLSVLPEHLVGLTR